MQSKRWIRGGLVHVTVFLCWELLPGASAETLVELHPGHRHVVQRAEFALRELQELSDTGIFRTLSLDKIAAATTQVVGFSSKTHEERRKQYDWMISAHLGGCQNELSCHIACEESTSFCEAQTFLHVIKNGVFHFNTHLTLDLASPYFASGRQQERFEVVVMEHKEDGHASFTIDSFPDMNPQAMEHFYAQKVERHRYARASLFAMIDSQTDGACRAWEQAGESDPGRPAITVTDLDPHQLLALLDEGGQSMEDPIRQAVAVEVLRRLEERTI